MSNADAWALTSTLDFPSHWRLSWEHRSGSCLSLALQAKKIVRNPPASEYQHLGLAILQQEVASSRAAPKKPQACWSHQSMASVVFQLRSQQCRAWSGPWRTFTPNPCTKEGRRMPRPCLSSLFSKNLQFRQFLYIPRLGCPKSTLVLQWMGLKLRSPTWEARILPLNYQRSCYGIAVNKVKNLPWGIKFETWVKGSR